MKEAVYSHITHPLQPIYNHDSQILILGSFPSVKSRDNNFYYGNPTNRFWKVLETLYQTTIIDDNAYKTKFLLENNIAIYDVIKSCDIIQSSDSSIKNVVVADIKSIVDNSKITTIYVNGNTAYKLYQKYLEKIVGIKAIKLPSTSAANARYSILKLLEKWEVINHKIKFDK